MLRGREVLRSEVMPREVGRGRVLVFCIGGGAGACEKDRNTQRVTQKKKERQDVLIPMSWLCMSHYNLPYCIDRHSYEDKVIYQIFN